MGTKKKSWLIIEYIVLLPVIEKQYIIYTTWKDNKHTVRFSVSLFELPLA